MIINQSNYTDIISYFKNDDLLSNNIIYQLHKYTLNDLSFCNSNDRYDLISSVTLGNSKLLGNILLTEDKEHYYESDNL